MREFKTLAVTIGCQLAISWTQETKIAIPEPACVITAVGGYQRLHTSILAASLPSAGILLKSAFGTALLQCVAAHLQEESGPEK